MIEFDGVMTGLTYNDTCKGSEVGLKGILKVHSYTSEPLNCTVYVDTITKEVVAMFPNKEFYKDYINS